MAKETGIGMTVTVDAADGTGDDLSNDITSVQISTPRGMQDITGLDKSAIERILLLADGTITLNGVFNDAADKSHVALKTIPTQASTGTGSTRTIVIAISGQTLTIETVGQDYSLNRAQDGSLTWTATFLQANGTAPTWS